MPKDPADLKRRLDAVMRMMEHFGLRGGEAEDTAIALLIPENHPDSTRRVSTLDAHSAVRNDQRAAMRRTETEGEACRRRSEAALPSGPPTRVEQREARGLLVRILREGARRVDARDLRDFALGLLEYWRRDPRSVLGSRSRGEGAIRAVFGSQLLPWGAEVTSVLERSAIVRILLRALRMWSRIELPPRLHCRRPV